MHRDLSFDRLDRTDIVLGIESHASYADTVVAIAEGDLIFLYTDGISEEIDDHDEPYGEERILAELREAHRLDLRTIVERVYGAVINHTGGRPQDDLTALAVRIESLHALQKKI
jgi:sigma-B regulation protein RsbU (phosphoserine phosphatase)